MNVFEATATGSRHLQFGHRGKRRPGLSALEFVGCLMALVGGAWLGAIYIGVDVNHLAYVALAESEMLDKVPEQWRPVDSENPNATTPAELAQAVQEELVALRREINALQSRQGSTSAAADRSDGDETSPAGSASAPQTKTASLAFWNRIQEVVNGQTELQIDAESAANSANATKVAALKGRISRFAGSAIRAIPTDGVDRSAIELGNQLADWYERGGELYEEAVRIWESPARSQSNPALTQGWEHARSQHRNEGKLLNDRVAAVSDSLTRRFGDGFAPFTAL